MDEESLKKFSEFGYYSAPLKLADGTVLNTTRIIGLNTNACYNLNYYLVRTINDPGNQLAWLEKELQEMEKLGQFAIIIGHVSNQDECDPSWGQRFHALYERYQHIIRVSAYGHKHEEQFAVIRGIRD